MTLSQLSHFLSVGLSNSLPEQIKQILDVVTIALRSVSSSHRAAITKHIQDEQAEEARRIEELRRRQSILAGTWHDGRLDCIAGNGVISELGVGDELFSDDMSIPSSSTTVNVEKIAEEDQEQLLRKQKAFEDVEAIKALPIVVIRNYATSLGSSSNREDVLVALAQWAAKLTENQVSALLLL